MLLNITQNDKGLLPVINKYGCLFLCLAQASCVIYKGNEGREKLNSIWNEAVSKGYISGDINHDGDFDDAGEAEIQNHDAVARLLGLNVHYDGVHHDASENIPTSTMVVIGCYTYKYSHFVLLNHSKKVIFDSLGSSYTVKYGKLKSMRFYSNK